MENSVSISSWHFNYVSRAKSRLYSLLGQSKNSKISEISGKDTGLGGPLEQNKTSVFSKFYAFNYVPGGESKGSSHVLPVSP